MGAIPVHALPGETQETVTKKFYSNSFFRGLKLRQSCVAAGCNLRRSTFISIMFGDFLETHYPAYNDRTFYTFSFNDGIFKGYEFSYSFGVNLDRKIVFAESIGLSNLSSQDRKRYDDKNYDLRRDSLITQVMTKVWGDHLVNDYNDAKYTDTFAGGAGKTRRIYQGREFAYQITNTRNKSIGIKVIVPEYIKSLRVQGEEDERL